MRPGTAFKSWYERQEFWFMEQWQRARMKRMLRRAFEHGRKYQRSNP